MTCIHASHELLALLIATLSDHLTGVEKRWMIKMKTAPKTKTSMFHTISAAIAAAGSVRIGQTPRDADLIVLGIDPVQFRTIGKN